MASSNYNKISSIYKNKPTHSKKIKTESKGIGAIKTLCVLLLIGLQVSILAVSYLYFSTVFEWYYIFSVAMTIITCIYILSSDFHGQAKATWIFFLLISFGFGYIIYFMSDKKVLFAKSRKKYNRIINSNKSLKVQTNINDITNTEVKSICNFLYSSGKFPAYSNSKTTYFSSGNDLWNEIIKELKNAKKFIFIEYYIISNGQLLNEVLTILKQKASEGVDVRIIYDDMGSHGTLKRQTKKEIIQSNIKLQTFNKLVPVFNIALNLRNHKKIVIIDGIVSFTGGANLADEYINKKIMYGYWKDSGIKIEGNATNNFTLSFLEEWEFLTNKSQDYVKFLNKSENIINKNEVVIPFTSGPNYTKSIAHGSYTNIISNAKERIYIMTPYFIPDETLINLLQNKAKSGVDVKIFLPEIADKKFVYVVSRNNAEKLMPSGVRLFTMNDSFVHSKVLLTENSALIGSINMDVRSFNQQFESGVVTNQAETISEILKDFTNTCNNATEINEQNKKRNSKLFRATAGLFNLISPFM